MPIRELLRWQWEGYPRYHHSRFNLLLHIVVVPLFLTGNAVLLAALVMQAWLAAGTGMAAMIVSMALQGRGHRQELVPPEPFTSPFNAVARIFCEQWITFPRFVLSGGWLRTSDMRSAGMPHYWIGWKESACASGQYVLNTAGRRFN